MGNTVAQFTMDFSSNASATVRGTAGELQTLQSSLSDSSRRIGEYQRALSTLKAGGAGATEQAKAVQAQLYAHRGAAAAAQARILELGGSLERTPKAPMAPATDNLKLFAKGVGLGEDRVERMRILLGSTAVRATLFAGALAATGAAVARLTVLASEARLTERLQLGSVGDGAALQGVIDDLTRSLPTSRAELAKLATSLDVATARSSGAGEALRALAIAQAGGGDTALSAARKQIEAANGSTAAIERVGAAVRGVYSDASTARVNLLSVQTARLGERLADVFGGADVSRLGSGLRQVNDLLARGSVVGDALRNTLAAVVDPLIGGLGDGESALARFTIGATLGFQRLVIGALELRNGVADALSGTPIGDWINSQRDALSVGKIAVYGLAGAVGALGVALISASAPLSVVVGGIGMAVAAYKILSIAVTSAYTAIRSVDWGGIATSIVDGLANGVLAGLGAVRDAFARMANAGVDAFKSALGIRSPSARMHALQGDVTAGVTTRANTDRPLVQRTYVATYAPSSQTRAAIATRLSPPQAAVAPRIVTPRPSSAAQADRAAAAPPRAPQIKIERGAFAITINGTAANAQELGQEIVEYIEERIAFRLMALRGAV